MIDIKNPNFEYITETSEAKRVVKEVLASKDILGVDTEATALDPYDTKLLFVQVGTERKSFIFDAQKVDVTVLKPVLEDKKILKLAQNAKFDYALLKVQVGMTIENIFDTMLAEQIITNGLARRQASLGFMAQKYLDIKLDKDWDSYNWLEVGRTGKVDKRHLRYAALDTLVLFPIFKKQFELLKK